MHDLVKDGIEGYLSGRLPSGELAFFRQHTSECAACRAEVSALEAQSQLIRVLRATDEELAPAAGFYGRVMERIEAQRPASLWSFFMEPIFARRVAYATMALFLLLGSSVLWTGESHDALLSDSNPVGVLAGMGPRAETASNPDMQNEAVMAEVLSADHQVRLVTVAE